MNKRKIVIALGFFDGVHRGHGALLSRVAQRARELDAVPAAFTFDVHPASQILGRQIPQLSTPEDRAGLMARYYGIQRLEVGRFEDMVRMPWRDFVTEYLQKQLGAVHVVAGHDFHFGYRGEGNPARLKQLCAEIGVECEAVQTMRALGAACGISVGAAAAAILV